jgi:hypothetical protein
MSVLIGSCSFLGRMNNNKHGYCNGCLVLILRLFTVKYGDFAEDSK